MKIEELKTGELYMFLPNFQHKVVKSTHAHGEFFRIVQLDEPFVLINAAGANFGYGDRHFNSANLVELNVLTPTYGTLTVLCSSEHIVTVNDEY